MKELEKTYNPADIEERLYQKWLDNKYFHADAERGKREGKKPFTIVMPPPNITGHLHMGHALDNTMQDILIRYKRMQGFEALWQPGTDHAAISTEVKVIDKLRKQGINKDDLGREGFLKEVWAWRDEYGSRIVKQLHKLGTSADWDRERFTMDEGCSDAVLEVFTKLYEKGYIYKGSRIINWCPVCQTSISDAEVEHEEQDGFFWHINYPIVGEEGRFVEIATTRPETLLGDTAVAVNPEDERYADLIGKMLKLPLTDREIPVIADSYVDKEFGTGCVKITPAHDPNDFEVGKRHNLPELCIMNDDATISAKGKYFGMDRYEARKAMVEDLKEMGLLVKVVPHPHNVGTHDRCGATVEPMVKPQWFVKMDEMAKPAIEALKSGQLKFVPESYGKTYLHWLEGIRDWCISRQIWWGHRIPAYYCEECGEMVVAKTCPEVCPKCGHTHFKQDEDTLDTWFSSALWPFSTLGWPKNTAELEYFYPTDVLVTGYDIIFFWVIRMVFSGIEQTGQCPFHTVLIHGLVRDSQGRKMSKSLGNGIDPLEIIDKYGADALRFALATGNSPGNDMRFSDEKIENARNFANKLWNAARFVMMNLTIDKIELPSADKLSGEDKWVLTKLEETVKNVCGNIDNYEVGVALSSIYDFIWDIYCDWYIELSKPSVQAGGERGIVAQNVLAYVLRETLKLLHPFMPFITEEIYSGLPGEDGSIMVKSYPEYTESLVFAAESDNMEKVIAAIRAIRIRRAEMNVVPSRKAKVFIETKYPEAFEGSGAFFEKLASASAVELVDAYDDDTAVLIITDSATIHIPLGDMIDFEAEKKRLQGELATVESEIKRAEGKLSNESFVSRAPAAVVDAERTKLEKYKEKRESLIVAIEKLG
ncbi:MAG: valine--tRNA ligase [Clostridia bacterium]|nr:valine--tRNA ligase [Clostridia bacterium]